MGSAGLQTAAIGFGGDLDPGTSGLANTYDGTSWSSIPSLNVARRYLAGASAGTTTASLAIGGQTSPGNVVSGAVEEWNGAGPTTVTLSGS